VADMREIWSLQPRFERRSGQAPYRLAEHMRLRAGYDFLMLRVETGEAPEELGRWWTDFLAADSEGRAALVAAAPRSGQARKRRRPRRRNPQGEPTPRAGGAGAWLPGTAPAAPARAGGAGPRTPGPAARGPGPS